MVAEKFDALHRRVFSSEVQNLSVTELQEVLKEVRSLEWNPNYVVLTRKVEEMERRLKGMIDERKPWYQKPIGLIGIGIIIVVLGAMALVAIGIKS